MGRTDPPGRKEVDQLKLGMFTPVADIVSRGQVQRQAERVELDSRGVLQSC